MKFGRNVLQVNPRRWTESDFRFDIVHQNRGNDVISRRKVLPPRELTRNICPATMQQRTLVPDL